MSLTFHPCPTFLEVFWYTRSRLVSSVPTIVNPISQNVVNTELTVTIGEKHIIAFDDSMQNLPLQMAKARL